jgi:hypothetical protein
MLCRRMARCADVTLAAPWMLRQRPKHPARPSDQAAGRAPGRRERAALDDAPHLGDERRILA